jgi:hypothetical protein
MHVRRLHIACMSEDWVMYDRQRPRMSGLCHACARQDSDYELHVWICVIHVKTVYILSMSGECTAHASCRRVHITLHADCALTDARRLYPIVHARSLKPTVHVRRLYHTMHARDRTILCT